MKTLFAPSKYNEEDWTSEALDLGVKFSNALIPIVRQCKLDGYSMPDVHHILSCCVQEAIALHMFGWDKDSQ